MSPEALDYELHQMLDKASRSLEVSKRLLKSGDYDFASSRAYYTVFYDIEAVLLTKNLSFSKHQGVIAAFNQHFVKSGLFPKEFGKLINRLLRDRQAGDYFFEPMDQSDAREDAQISERILAAIAEYLEREGFLKPNSY